MKKSNPDKDIRTAVTEIKGLVDLRSFIDALVGCVKRGKDEDFAEIWIRVIIDSMQGRIGFGLKLVAGVDGLSEDAAAVTVAASFLGSPFCMVALLPLLTFSEERVRQALVELEELKVVVALDDECRAFAFPNLKSDSIGNGVAVSAAAPSQRERDVARLITQGLTNYQIGMHLGLSQRTVETYVRRLFMKLNVSSRSQIVAWHVGQGGIKVTSEELACIFANGIGITFFSVGDEVWPHLFLGDE